MSIYFAADSTAQHSAGVGASSAGKVLDLQQYQTTGSISHSSNTFTDIASFSLNLTPQTNSKVLISFCGSKGATTTNPVRFRPVRTIGGSATALGMQSTADWQGNYATMGNYIGGDNANQILHVAFQWIDASPGGNGSTTINYKLQWAINSGTAYLGQSSPVSIVQRAGGIQFYVMEIGA